MFIRRNRRLVHGEVYDYFTLVKTIQTAQGPRQQVVANLGKTPRLDRPTRQGWEEVADLLEGRAPAPVQGELGKDFSKPPRHNGRRWICGACGWKGCVILARCICPWPCGVDWDCPGCSRN